MKNMSMKKWLALVMGICMMLTMLPVAVAEEAGMDNLPVKDMEGRVFRIHNGSNGNRDNYDDWLLELEETYNCKIEYVNAGDYSTIANSIMGGDPLADIIVMNDTYFYNFVNRKLLLDLNSLEYIYPDDADYYWQGVTEIATVGDKCYGVDSGTGPLRRILVYNKNLINGEDDLQLLQEKGELTWEKLAEVLQKVVNGGKGGLSGQMYPSDVVETFIAANGGRIFERDGLTFNYAYDTQNTRNAIAFVQEMYKNGLVTDNPGNWQYPQSQFAKGKVGAFIADGWNLSYIYQKAKFEIGMVLMPMGPDAPAQDHGLVDYTVFSCYAIAATTENPEDVALIYSAYIKAVNENEGGKQNWRLAWEDTVDDEKNMEVLEAYVTAVDNGTCFVDYKNAVTSLYDDGLFEWQEGATKALVTPQAYLEAVSAIYKAKAEDFNK